MSSNAPPPSSRQPAGVPSSGSGKYVVLAVVLLGLIGAAVAWKMSQKPPTPQIVYVDAAPPPTFAGRNPDEDVPPPPPIEDAGEQEAPKKVTNTQPATNQCDVKKCTGSNSPDLETALQFRVKQAHRCYDNALAQDPTLRGKITVAVRVGPSGQLCSASIASNEMGSQAVGSCVAGYFRGTSFPAPRGGCVDVNIPINFVPRQ
ncbi:MAG TPA: AgmX/PglI C-terminal domain-containing protein [Labilithrix sp.]|jgi:hypothetical protein|nr:AgmX/PglI C-terminal domain-containing protein [Labilithrix sp.]